MSEEKKEQIMKIIMEEYDLKPSMAKIVTNATINAVEESLVEMGLLVKEEK